MSLNLGTSEKVIKKSLVIAFSADDNCIRKMDKSNAENTSHSESLKMKAGTYVTIPVLLDSKSQIIKFKFSIAKGLDAELSCTLFDGEEIVELLPPRRVIEVTDSLRVNLQLEPGGHRMIEFKLSNVFSWVRSKRFTYSISVQPEPQSPHTQNPVPIPAVVNCSSTVALRDAEAEVERCRIDFASSSQEQGSIALRLRAAEIELEKMAQTVNDLRVAVLSASQRSIDASAALSRAQTAAAAIKAGGVGPSVTPEAPGSCDMLIAPLSEQSTSEGHEAVTQPLSSPVQAVSQATGNQAPAPANASETRTIT